MTEVVPATSTPTPPPPARVATVLVCVLAGLLLALSATASRGLDLRAQRNADLVDLVREQRARNERLVAETARVRADVDRLTSDVGLPGTADEKVAQATAAGGLVPVTGPGVTVVLSDAPTSVAPAGVDPDQLVVHQQDIQAVLNLLWSGGAEAATLQGQRVVATTGIKCVGNTVIIHGVPYAPPYRISAIGDPDRLEAALATSTWVAAYRRIAAAYQLGWEQHREDALDLPAYSGPVSLRWAHR